jgi:two-component SAPR family response regulator
MTLADIGYIALTTGNIFEAQKSYREALNLAHKVRGSGNDFSNACNNFAYLNYLLGNYQESWTYYLQAQETAEINNLDRHLGYILNGQADLLRDLEELEQAKDLYLKALTLAESTQEDDMLSAALAGLVALETQAGDFNQAIYYLREKASVENQQIEAPPYLVSMAKIYFEMGQTDLAQKHILQVLDALPENQPPTHETAELHFHAALIQYAAGSADEAAAHLQKCLKTTALLGFDQFLVNAFRHHLKAVKKILTHLPEFPQVQSILKRASKKPPTLKELIAPATVPPEEEQISLNVTAFDGGAVRLNGENIPHSDWGSVGARALFYFILDRKQTTKDEIALEFWPEFSQAKVNSNFHATLWRVRNALSSRQILTFEKDHYQINPIVNYYYDLYEFEDLYNGLKKQKNELEKRTAMRRMAEIYQNDYLEDIDMPWADQRRRELQNIFYTILIELAEEEFDKKNYEAAHQHYLRAAQLDYYQDDLHLKIMQTLEAVGDKRRAIQHYRAYAKKLKSEMNIEPDPDLKDMAERLSA